jgi:2-dehydro-3-deoxy-D-arabinonate dehydratase
MKLCQFHLPGKGKRVGVVDGDVVIDVTSPKANAASTLDLVTAGGTAAGVERLVRPLLKKAKSRLSFRDLDRAPSPRRPHLLAPIDAPEVWGAGITYERSRGYYEAHQTEGTRSKGIYDYVYEAKRPELFFKGTASRTSGPNAPIGVRADSTLTAVEAELAVVIGRRGAIVGYTVGNDLSAWDIERENPLYLPQSKIFDGSFACGPVLVTAGEIPDPHTLELSCTISRNGAPRFEGRTNTSTMKRRCPELVDWLCRGNTCSPPGTVLSTGTGLLVPDEHALQEGDVVEITLERVGTLRNPVRRLPT